MHLRTSKHRRKDGSYREYSQLAESFRREDGTPSHRVIAHLGPLSEAARENLKAALAANRRNARVEEVDPPSKRRRRGAREVVVEVGLDYLPIALVNRELEAFGFGEIARSVFPESPRGASAADTLTALIAHRCLAPGSKLSFQRWVDRTALPQILGVDRARLNDTRIHRVLDALHEHRASTQQAVEARVVSHGTPRLLFLDLTDTWFEGRSVPLSRRGRTKAGHRSKRKVNIALLVNEEGLPMRWEVLSGALNETTVLPGWIDWLHTRPALKPSVLIFDRGLPSAANFKRLLDQEAGHLFLTSVKSDSIPGLVEFDNESLDALQEVGSDAKEREVERACAALGLTKAEGSTYVRDLGLARSTSTVARRKDPLPLMRVYAYFNREIQLTKRSLREEKIEKLKAFVSDLNRDLKQAKKTRAEAPTRRKVERELQRYALLECFEVELHEVRLEGKTRQIVSWEVVLQPREDRLRQMARYDGLTVLVGHPDLGFSASEAVAAYRAKDVVEADFRTMKSVLELRPVFHRTDEKVAAHTSVCVLALLLERLIERRLQAAGDPALPRTAAAAFEELQTIRLNHVRVDGKHHVTLTAATERQKSILAALSAEHLLELPAHLATGAA